MKTALSRKLFSLLLCVLFCISLLPAQVFADGTVTATVEPAEETAAPEETTEAAEEAEGEEPAEEALPVSGECGENLTWALDENGVLTISGTGTMTDWSEERIPWTGSVENITSVVLEDGVEDIGEYAFSLCNNLQSVSVPASVTEIHDFAFYYCSALTGIALPQNLKSIGDYAFAGCTELKNVTFTGNAVEFGSNVFSNDAVTAYVPQGNDTWTEEAMQLENGPEAWSTFRAGDVNNDGVVDEDDLALVQATVDGTEEDGTVNLAAADLNGDGIVSAEDTAILEQQLADGTADQLTIYFNANGGECDTESVSVLNGTAIETMPEATLECYNFEGWFTGAADGDQITSETPLTANATLYAHWSVQQFTVAWEESRCAEISVERTSSPMAGASCGSLENGSIVYYGDELKITYTPVEGFTNYSYGVEYVTVDRNITAEDIFATADLLEYTVTWEAGDHTTVTVTRTESPLAGAETGELESGATVYYNDVLTVTYDVDFGYTMDHGEENLTVTGDIGPESIYASATPNEYTYHVYYQSCNGTDLGSEEVTNTFGSTYTLTAPAVDGYTTPDAQDVAWDAESKDITFIYVPVPVTGGPLESGLFWDYANGVAGIAYSSEVEIGTRTADTVEIRIHWTQRIYGGYFGYRQAYNIGFGGGEATEYEICSSRKWCYDNGYVQFDSVTVSTDWITVPVNATQTSLTYEGKYWADSTALGGTLGGSFAIPTY